MIIKITKTYFDNLPVPVSIPGLNLATVQKYGDSDLAAVTKSGSFLPRVQLFTAKSNQAQDGSIGINHYGINDGGTIKDLGLTVDVLCLTWRPKALDMGEVVIASYKTDSNEFKRIAEKSMESDSGCMFGPEFLFWVPTEKKFATFLMGSKSMRREAKKWIPSYLMQPITLKSLKIETPKYTWFSPVATVCSTPFDMPSAEDIQEVAEAFNNPPESEVETAPVKTDGAAREV